MGAMSETRRLLQRNMHEQDPFPGSGLRLVQPGDRSQINSLLSHLQRPLSDYTFSQIFTWRNSLRLLWREIDGHLCVFANGTGDLTMLLPPIGGDTRADHALHDAFDLMNDYNAAHGIDARGHSRVEYISEELLQRFDSRTLAVEPMGHDYLYTTRSMIDLAGGDLKSKRQDRNRFLRDHDVAIEEYRANEHREACTELLKRWDQQHAATESPDRSTTAIKRRKEMLAVQMTLEHADALGLAGMIVRAAPKIARMSMLPIVAFTFGETLNDEQCSIVIEKTDLQLKGLAQFVFSEFCRRAWTRQPLVNVGDDWGLPSLAWTKMSYRPCELLKKFSAKQNVAAQSLGLSFIGIRQVEGGDLAGVQMIENACFDTHRLSLRQLQYLAGRVGSTSSFHVAVDNDQIVGEAIGLLRHTRGSIVGRVYSLAVSDAHRGRHLGRRLLQTLLDDLEFRGATRISLEVDLRSAAAIHLYESLGFRQVATLSDYYGDGHDGIRMSRTARSLPKPRAVAA